MKPLVILSLLLTPSYAIDGLFGYWSFDEGSGDLAGDAISGNDGTVLEPDGAWITDDPDRVSVFDATGSSTLEFGTILPTMDLENGFTWSFWAYSFEATNNNIILGNRYNEDGTDFAPREFIKFTPNQFEWHVDGAGQNINYDDLPLEQWVHHLVVKDGTTLTYYRDGEESGTREITSAPANPQPFYAAGQGTRENWSGRLDELALFDRALTPEEVEEVYLLGRDLSNLSGPSDDPNLIAPRDSAFGQVPAIPQQREATITIQNRGSAQPLSITDIAVTGSQKDHFTVLDFPTTIAPGESGVLTYRFDSLSLTGGFRAFLEIMSNDTSDPTISISVSASIVNLQGPQAHYRFDEVAGETILRDSSGRDLEGTYRVDPGTLTLGSPPLASGTSISVRDGAQAQIAGSAFPKAFNTFSVALWFQPTDLSQDLRTLFGKGGTTPSFAVLLQGSNLVWIEGEDPTPILASENDAILAGQKYHLVAISDQSIGSRRIALYLDGALVAEQLDPTRVADVREDEFHIGAFNNALGFRGSLDDLQIYDRALSASQVSDLFVNPGKTLGETTEVDSDGDGLSDAEEASRGTDPLKTDTDADGLSDNAEVTTHLTNPTNNDSDGDGFKDGFEILQSTDPNDATSKPETISVPGLFAYWPFDDGAGDIVFDESGNARNGTIISPDGVWETDAERGTVYHSNTSSYVDFGEILPAFTLESGFTWSFWSNSEETGTNNIVLGNRYALNGADFAPREFVKFTSTTFEWHVDGAGQNMTVDGLPTDVWSHQLVTKNGDALTYYRDGVEIGTSTITSAPANAQPFYLGGQNGVETWSGLIDEVALWDRALSPEEAITVYQTGLAGQRLDGGNSAPNAKSSILAIARAINSLVLTWPADTAGPVNVEFSVDLLVWTPVASGIEESSYTDTEASRVSASAGYYRLTR